MLPVTFGWPMLSAFKFEPDPQDPDLIWTRNKPGPVGRQELMARQLWVDPFEARQRFLRARDREEILSFLNSLGASWSHETAPVVSGEGKSRIVLHEAQPIFISGILEFQEFTRLALARPFSKWQRLSGGGYLYVETIRSLETQCGEKKRVLVLEFVPTTLSQAILGTVIADKLAKNKYRLCELPECRMPFKAGTRQPPKRFCLGAHRTVAAMRRYRRKKSRKEGKHP